MQKAATSQTDPVFQIFSNEPGQLLRGLIEKLQSQHEVTVYTDCWALRTSSTGNKPVIAILDSNEGKLPSFNESFKFPSTNASFRAYAFLNKIPQCPYPVLTEFSTIQMAVEALRSIRNSTHSENQKIRLKSIRSSSKDLLKFSKVYIDSDCYQRMAQPNTTMPSQFTSHFVEWYNSKQDTIQWGQMITKSCEDGNILVVCSPQERSTIMKSVLASEEYNNSSSHDSEDSIKFALLTPEGRQAVQSKDVLIASLSCEIINRYIQKICQQEGVTAKKDTNAIEGQITEQNSHLQGQINQSGLSRKYSGLSSEKDEKSQNAQQEVAVTYNQDSTKFNSDYYSSEVPVQSSYTSIAFNNSKCNYLQSESAQNDKQAPSTIRKVVTVREQSLEKISEHCDISENASFIAELPHESIGVKRQCTVNLQPFTKLCSSFAPIVAKNNQVKIIKALVEQKIRGTVRFNENPQEVHAPPQASPKSASRPQIISILPKKPALSKSPSNNLETQKSIGTIMGKLNESRAISTWTIDEDAAKPSKSIISAQPKVTLLIPKSDRRVDQTEKTFDSPIMGTIVPSVIKIVPKGASIMPSVTSIKSINLNKSKVVSIQSIKQSPLDDSVHEIKCRVNKAILPIAQKVQPEWENLSKICCIQVEEYVASNSVSSRNSESSSFIGSQSQQYQHYIPPHMLRQPLVRMATQKSKISGSELELDPSIVSQIQLMSTFIPRQTPVNRDMSGPKFNQTGNWESNTNSQGFKLTATAFPSLYSKIQTPASDGCSTRDSSIFRRQAGTIKSQRQHLSNVEQYPNVNYSRQEKENTQPRRRPVVNITSPIY